MNVLEHRYRYGAHEGQTSTQSQTDMIVVGFFVKDARSASVRLGEAAFAPLTGLTRLPECLQVKAGTAISLDFVGDGAVEVLGVRVPRTKTMGPLSQGQPCPVCAIVVGDTIEHRCFQQPKAE